MIGNQDTEFTLNTGKLLGFFFGMVVICGIFFSLGYAVGKNSSPAASAAIIDSASLSTVTTAGGTKPSPGRTGAQPVCAEGDSNCNPAAGATNSGGNAGASATAAELKEVATTSTPEMKAESSGSGYMVQVAAVSKEEDAEALVAALRKKQYPVFIVNNATSHLFHVQVGPFAEQKEAEAMKTKLSGDGYNAILKK